MVSAEWIKYSLKNLWNRKTRSALTLFSIFIGITTIFIFISFGWGLYDYMQEFTTGSSADKIIIQPKGTSVPGLDTTFKLTDEDLKVIERTAGVYEATGLYFKIAEVQQDKKKVYTFLIGYDPKYPMMFEFSNVDLNSGRWLKPGETGNIIAGYNYFVEDRIFPKAYELNQEIDIGDKSVKIVGFLDSIGSPPDDAQLYTTNDFIENLYPDEELSYGWIMARVDMDNIDLVVERVENALRKERNLEKGKEDFFVQSFQDMMEMYASALNIVVFFVILIALISVLVSAVNTANTMVTSVLERTKEIGIMKAIGSRNSEIFKLFLFESSFIGFTAGCIGVLLGWLISYGGGFALEGLGWGFLSPHFSPWLFVGCVAFATITGAISGVAPARNAAKTNIVDALRYE